MTVFNNSVRKPQLANTTPGLEGALLVGTDTKTQLGNATTAEAVFTFLDTFVLSTGDLFGLTDLRQPAGDPFEIRSNYGISIRRNGDIYFLDADVQTGDIPTLVEGDGIEINQVGSTYTISTVDATTTVSGGQGVTVAVSGTDFKVHVREERVVLTDSSTVTLDGANDNNFYLAMGSSPTGRTIAFSNFSRGQKFTLLVKNSGSNTITWPTVKWPGAVAPTLTAVANRGDLFGFEKLSDDTYLAFTLGQNYTL